MSRDDGIYMVELKSKIWGVKSFTAAWVAAIDNLDYHKNTAEWEVYLTYLNDVWGKGPFFFSKDKCLQYAKWLDDKEENDTEYGIVDLGALPLIVDVAAPQALMRLKEWEHAKDESNANILAARKAERISIERKAKALDLLVNQNPELRSLVESLLRRV